ncbi:hypothetical protein [Bacteriovorax sp. DB6_IX]|uniref:hypothetical protein n=1 Tax=Bacteriovorax sp. DB6_IX TaxID=1353530 RepID=UPI0005532434|nr:hypothetical protein [Bacteriovorax sp. DB6_IX]
MFLNEVSPGKDIYLKTGLWSHIVFTILTTVILITEKPDVFKNHRLNEIDYILYLIISSMVAFFTTILWFLTIPLYFLYLGIISLLFYTKNEPTIKEQGSLQSNTPIPTEEKSNVKAVSRTKKKLKRNINYPRLIGVLGVLSILYYIFILPDYYITELKKIDSGMYFNGEVYPPLGTEYTTKKPLYAIDNMPLTEEVSDYIRSNSYTRTKGDSLLRELRNSCSGCLRYDRIITPIRISYVPAGTKLIIKDYFAYNHRGLARVFNSASVTTVLEDQNGKTYEISPLGIKLRINAGISRDEEDIVKLQNKSITIKGCTEMWSEIKHFSKALKLTDAEATLTKIPNEDCGTLKFLDKSAQNTFLYYRDELFRRDFKLEVIVN